MEYTDNDLKNIIALCEQGEESDIATNLANRCKRALAYRDVTIRITKKEKQFLSSLYDEDMDKDAMDTINRITGKNHN